MIVKFTVNRYVDLVEIEAMINYLQLKQYIYYGDTCNYYWKFGYSIFIQESFPGGDYVTNNIDWRIIIPEHQEGIYNNLKQMVWDRIYGEFK